MAVSDGVRPSSRLGLAESVPARIGSRGDYEAWLDELDRKLLIEKGVIHAKFGKPISFAFAEYKSIAGMKECARRLRCALRESASDLPREYLIRRFLRLAKERSRVHTSVDFVMDQLRDEWRIEALSDW